MPGELDALNGRPTSPLSPRGVVRQPSVSSCGFSLFFFLRTRTNQLLTAKLDGLNVLADSYPEE